MNHVSEFRVGEHYTNDQIRFSLNVGNLGGIRPSVDALRNLRHLVIITAGEQSGKLHADNPYRDRIEGNVLLYTAAGREGDQQLEGANRRLLEQYSVPVPFYGFMNVGQQTYRFLGLLELVRHYQEMQLDRRGAMRMVWLFELRIHDEPATVPILHAAEISAALLAESRRQNGVDILEREIADIAQGGERGGVSAYSPEAEILRSRLFQIAPYRFEQLIQQLMRVSGFTDVTVTAASGDGGIDLNAYVDEDNDFFAGTHVQTQVKRWRHAVGSVEINNFRGSLNTTAKGVFVTTSQYTRAAVREARHTSKPAITLIDGTRLSNMLLKKGVNVEASL